MALAFTVLSDATSKEWEPELARLAAAAMPGAQVDLLAAGASRGMGALVFLSAAATDLEKRLASVDRQGRVVLLVSKDPHAIPEAVLEGRADDVLIYPFRLPELLGKLRIFEQLLMIEEVTRA